MYICDIGLQVATKYKMHGMHGMSQVVDIVGTTYTVQPIEGGPVKRVKRPCVNPPILTPGNVMESECEPDVVMETVIVEEEGVIEEEVSLPYPGLMSSPVCKLLSQLFVRDRN